MSKVVIIMGSKSNLPWSGKIVEALDKSGVERVLRVASAHKVPLKCYELIKEYEREDMVFITIAGRSDALLEIKRDVDGVGKISGVVVGPYNPDDEFYLTLLETAKPMLKHLLDLDTEVLRSKAEEAQIVQDWIIRQDKMRGSLG